MNGSKGMKNHAKSRTVTVSCVVAALVTASVAEIPRADRYEARNGALRSIEAQRDFYAESMR